ncbi:MAG: hypothetical protein ACTSWP_12480 [Candidatus Freyarchaeota archaeon]
MGEAAGSTVGRVGEAGGGGRLQPKTPFKNATRSPQRSRFKAIEPIRQRKQTPTTKIAK